MPLKLPLSPPFYCVPYRCGTHQIVSEMLWQIGWKIKKIMLLRRSDEDTDNKFQR